MRPVKTSLALVSVAVLLQACATPPMGPSVSVMPAPNKPFSVFQEDQAICKDYAHSQVAGQAERANERGVGAAVLGTALGAGLGAAVGGGRGAAIGAASGAVVGTGVGAGHSSNVQYTIQQQYDNAYMQCMYSRGNQVPGAPPPAYSAPPPPPPPGYYPPPRG